MVAADEGALTRSAIGVFIAAASSRTRALVACIVVLAVAARLGVLGVALALGRSDAALAAVLGAVAATSFALQRVAQGSARVAAQCDLHRATARTLLDGDVLDVPTADTQRIVFDGNHQAAELLTSILPALVADLVAAGVMAPVLAGLFSGRVLGIAAVLVAVIVLSAVAVRRATRALQERVMRTDQEVADVLLVAIDGRLEVVAGGAEARLMEALDSKVAAYQRLALRSALSSALLGRAPIAAALVGVALIVAFDPASREALTAAVVTRALVLAAAIPPLLGCVLGAHAMTRSAALAAPLRELLSAPRREDVARAGAGAPDLPATITAEALAFAYTPGSEPIFRNVACAWSSGAPLVIVGPNGSGKSTLLRLLVGLRRPTEGVVRVAGRDLAEIDARDLRRQVAYLPQRPYLGEPYTSVRSALGFASAHVPDDAAMMRALDRTRVAEALAQRPRGMLDAAVGQLSVGQRQRVALARLLLQDAAVFLLDEPDANLDRAGIELVAALVAELIAEGKMVAIAAHTPELAAIGGARVTLG